MKKAKFVAWVICAVILYAIGGFCVLFGLVGLLASPDDTAFCICFIAFGLVFIVPAAIGTKKLKGQRKSGADAHTHSDASNVNHPSPTSTAIAYRDSLQSTSGQTQPRQENKIKKEKTPRPYIRGKFNMAGGLDIPAGVPCNVEFYDDHIGIVALGREYKLPHRKIQNVSISTIKELQKQYVSSAGGAILGAAIAGPLGALIGGGAKQKTIRSNKHLLIFAYTPNEDSADLSQIIF